LCQGLEGDCIGDRRQCHSLRAAAARDVCARPMGQDARGPNRTRARPTGPTSTPRPLALQRHQRSASPS
jgi:hypothetical protein